MMYDCDIALRTIMSIGHEHFPLQITYIVK